MHQSSGVLRLAQANENLSTDVIKLLFRLLICNQSTPNIILCRTPCKLLVMEKKQDQTLVPATNAGKIAWVMIIFSVSLLKSYPEMHCFAFSPLCTFLCPHALPFVLHWTVPADLSQGPNPVASRVLLGTGSLSQGLVSGPCRAPQKQSLGC